MDPLLPRYLPALHYEWKMMRFCLSLSLSRTKNVRSAVEHFREGVRLFFFFLGVKKKNLNDNSVINIHRDSSLTGTAVAGALLKIKSLVGDKTFSKG